MAAPINLRPLADTAVLVVAVTYGILLRIAMAAGFMGISLGALVGLSLWRYGYELLRHVAYGKTNIPPPGPETLNPFHSLPLILHFLFFSTLIWLLGSTPLLAGSPVLDALRWVGFVAVAGAFPASAAVMGVTDNLAAALNPKSVATVIHVLGRRYLALLGISVALVVVAETAESRLGHGAFAVIGDCLSVWSFLALFALIGSAVREHGADFDLPGESERFAERAEQERYADWRKSLDRAYASIRSGLVTEGYSAIKDLAAAEGESLDIYQWLFNSMLTWEDHSHALALGKRFVERLIASRREHAALDLVRQCRRISPEFTLPADAVAKLVAYARGIGRDGLADELATFEEGWR